MSVIILSIFSSFLSSAAVELLQPWLVCVCVAVCACVGWCAFTFAAAVAATPVVAGGNCNGYSGGSAFILLLLLLCLCG